MFAWIKNLSDSFKSKFESKVVYLKTYFHGAEYRKLNRESVARAVAIGLFVTFLPIMPFQTLLVLAITAVLKANIPVAFFISFLSNPITIAPIIIFTTSVGKFLLNENQSVTENFFHALGVKLGLIHEQPAIIQYGKEYFVGLPVVCISAAIIGYLLVYLFCFFYGLYKKV